MITNFAMPLFSALKYLSFMIPFMIFGVMGINLIIALGWLERLSYLARPVVYLGHLKSECGLSFIAAFGSPTAANAMLMELYQKGAIDKRELLIACLANSFPAIVMHSYSMLPILIPLLGLVGVVYFFILVMAGFIKTTLVLIVGHFTLSLPQDKFIFDRQRGLPLKQALIESLRKSKPMFKRILLVTIPITIITFYLIHLKFFDYLGGWLYPVSHLLPLSPQAITIVAAQFGGPLPAYTLASNLLVNHVLTGKEVVLALLLGTILTSIVGLRYLIPYYWGIFGPRLGTQIMLISMGTRQALIILMAIVVYYWP